MRGKLLFVGLFGSLFACNAPIAKFMVETTDEPWRAPVKISMKNESEKAESFLWNFGDGANSTEKDPTHRFLQSGKYVVSLTAMAKNKERTIEKTIIVEAPEKCLVEIQTEMGNMLVELFDDTPEHRDNFIKLAGEGFYDELLFHRVIDGFMIQGGDPESKGAGKGARLGSGGPGYTVPAEFNEKLAHVKGALSAARTGDAVNPEKRSSGSQFYIVHGKKNTEEMLNMMEARKNIKYSSEQRTAYVEQGGTPFLDMEYTVFGQVIEGLDIIDEIAKVSTDNADRPVDDVKMKIVVIQ